MSDWRERPERGRPKADRAESTPACERIGVLLAEWISGELDAEDSAEVRTHLAGCETCRMEEREMRGMLALLEADAAADSGVRDPGDAYWKGFAARVSAKLPENKAASSGAWSWLRFPQLVTGLGAAAVLAIALNLGLPTATTTSPAIGTDPELAAYFQETMAPPTLDGIASLGDAELDRLGRELASAVDAPRGTAPAASATEAPRDAIDPVRVPAPALIDDLSPEELDALLERLDAFERT